MIIRWWMWVLEKIAGKIARIGGLFSPMRVQAKAFEASGLAPPRSSTSRESIAASLGSKRA